MEQLRTLLGFIRRPLQDLDLNTPLPGFLTGPLSLGVKNPKLRRALGVKGGQRRERSSPESSSEQSGIQFSIEGPLEQGKKTLFSVNGYDLNTTKDTWIFGELVIGNFIKVKGVIQKGQTRVCTSIISTPL
jgi:hypothetical protein